mgnify:CR=1 FL=1
MSKFNWRFQGNEKKYLNEVLEAGFKAGADGAFSTRLESLFSEKYDVGYAIAFNSGTTTMHAALLALGTIKSLKRKVNPDINKANIRAGAIILLVVIPTLLRAFNSLFADNLLKASKVAISMAIGKEITIKLGSFSNKI